MIQYLQHNKKQKLKTATVLFLGTFLSLLSVLETPLLAQVKKYTKIEKTKRNTYNLEETAKTRKRQRKDKSVYKVYSDRSKNLVYLDPYAQKKGEEQDILTPFYVLDQENDYLEVATADPEVLGKPKGLFSFLFSGKRTFKDAKKAKYVGWVHKDNVIHYAHPKLSEYNYKPMRYAVGVQDLNTLYTIEKYVKEDSVYVFKDPLFKEKSDKKLLLDQFVFLYKYNPNKKAALVSNLAHLKPEDSVSRTIGWIPGSLLKQIGQQQVYAIDQVDSLAFFEKTKGTYTYIDANEIGGGFIYDLSKHKEKIIQTEDSTTVAVPISVWNHYDNKLINVDGEDVLIRKLKDIKADNKIVNFHFIFDCAEELKKKQLLLMSSLQRIWVLLSTEEKYKGYEFSFSASSYGCGKFYALPKTKSFSLWVDYLQNIFLDTKNYVASEKNTKGIEQCFEYATADMAKQSFTNNIIMVAGEERFFTPPNIKDITQKLGQTSSRIIFYQLENKADDQHQDYLLQAKDILGRVSTNHSGFIRAFIVENDLIKNENIFTSIPSVDNIYVYDSPDNSTYQGGVVFPKINKTLSATSFDKALDSVLSTTIRFNATFTGSLEYHAKKLGFLRSKSGEQIKEMILRDTTYSNSLGMLPRNYMYEKYYKNKKYSPQDNPDAVTGYLLSKEELEIAIDSYKSLVPLFSKEVKRKERRRLYRMYRKNSRNINKDLFRRTLRRKDYLADLIFTKTGIPVKNDFLLKTKIKHIKRKRRTSHAAFTKIVKELREKIEVLEEILSKKNTKMYTDGSKKQYYFISEHHIL